MAVVGLALGGMVLGAVFYDNHSDYSDYGDYDNYSDYSDAAVRQQRRIEAKQEEIEYQKSDINTYKIEDVNDYLQSEILKNKSGVYVKLKSVKEDGDSKIEKAINNESKNQTQKLVREIDDINSVLEKIDKILEEGK